MSENKTPNRINFIWHEIAKISDPCTGQAKFKHLTKLVKFLLLIPHSNAYSENIFSTGKKICTDDRHNLGKDPTECHASTSVYQSTTGIRNNLLGLLVTKVNIFLKQGVKCYEWKPSEKVIKSAKSVTYKNLTLRK